MEAKEKAIELVLNFLRIENNTPEWFNTHIAKQCALIAVDEIIEYAKRWGDMADDDIKEFKEVKTEINNL
jgi:hypothetical protein